MLKLNKVDAGYGGIQILRGVTFSVDKGQIACIVGANGAGKTTTVHCISGTIPLTGGSITFEDQDITHMEPHDRVARGLVQVPEGRKLFSSMTVLENLELGSYTKAAKIKRKDSLERIFNLFPRLRERIGQAAGTLSGGEQQMLAIGRGLMALPKLLLLDEPSLGLAPIIVAEIFQIVTEVNQEGTTVLLVEQNVQQSLNLANHGFVLENGTVTLTGSGEELLADPHLKEAYLGL